MRTHAPKLFAYTPAGKLDLTVVVSFQAKSCSLCKHGDMPGIRNVNVLLGHAQIRYIIRGYDVQNADKLSHCHRHQGQVHTFLVD